MECATNGGYFANHGSSPERRQKLFYGVCIPVRLALVIGVFAAAYHIPIITAWAAIVIGCIVVLRNMFVERGCRWWTPSTATIIGGAAVLVGALVVMKIDGVTPLLLGGLLLAHLATGVVHSIQVKPWD